MFRWRALPRWGGSMEKLATLVLDKLSPRQADSFKKVIQEASKDTYLKEDNGDEIVPKAHSVVILYGNTEEPVGYYTPKSQTYEGKRYWRAGTLYLLSRYRGKGIMQAALADYFDSKPRCLSWIEDANTDSVRMFTSLGFTKAKPKVYTERPGHWYVKENPQLSTESEPIYWGW